MIILEEFLEQVNKLTKKLLVRFLEILLDIEIDRIIEYILDFPKICFFLNFLENFQRWSNFLKRGSGRIIERKFPRNLLVRVLGGISGGIVVANNNPVLLLKTFSVELLK